MEKMINLQLTMDVYVNEYGDICTVQDDTVLTKPFLTIALKYNSEEELAKRWNIDPQVIEVLKQVFDINLSSTERLTKSRIKIMEVIQRYVQKFDVLPTLDYIHKRSKLQMQVILNEMQILSQLGYLKISNGNFYMVKAV